MGLLSDPGRQKTLLRKLVRFHRFLGIACWVGGLVWMVLLTQTDYNARTYVSENALLPGSSNLHYRRGGDRTVDEWSRLIADEFKELKGRLPAQWLMRELSAMDVDVYNQTFEMKYTYGQKDLVKSVSGTNVYGVLRPGRVDGTEGLVLGVACGVGASKKREHASLALAMSLMGYFARQKYWSRDIVLLVTEGGFVGLQAWLDAYHEVAPTPGMHFSALAGRAGTIQAAVFLNVPLRMNTLDLQFEGVNGQLTNLDVINAVVDITERRIGVTVHSIEQKDQTAWPLTGLLKDKVDQDVMKYVTWADQLWHMIHWQATGMPTGPHGLFYRYNIAAALTIKGVGPAIRNLGEGYHDLYVVGQVIEGTFRSLSNLLERFHQSFFFYLLPSAHRYVSIGLYMPPMMLTIAGLALTAISLWLTTGDWLDVDPPKPTAPQESTASSTGPAKYLPITGLAFGQRPRLIGRGVAAMAGSLIGGLLCTWLPVWALTLAPTGDAFIDLGCGLGVALVLYLVVSMFLIPADHTTTNQTSASQPTKPETTNEKFGEETSVNEAVWATLPPSPTWCVCKLVLCSYAMLTMACLALVNVSLALCLSALYALPCMVATRFGRLFPLTLLQLCAILALSPPSVSYGLSLWLQTPLPVLLTNTMQAYEVMGVYTYPIASMIAWPITLQLLNIVAGS